MELYICKYINIGYTYNLTYMPYNVTYIYEHVCKIYVSKYEHIYYVMYVWIYIYIYIYTVGTESIQTPLNFSLFVILQPFAKII